MYRCGTTLEEVGEARDERADGGASAQRPRCRASTGRSSATRNPLGLAATLHWLNTGLSDTA